MGMHTPPVGDLGDAATNLGAVLSGTSLEELRKRIDDILVAEAKRVVIVMDDIDRLEKNEIHAVLRLIKLTADFQFTAYILAFDHAMVASAIGDRYSGTPGGTFQAGMSFLEKIIQVPIHLPPITESALLVYCYECVEDSLREANIELTDQEAQTFGTLFQRSLARNVTTPRMAKRYANALTFSLTLLQGEVHLGELMLIEGLRVFLPRCFESIRDNKNLLLQPGRTLTNSKSEADVVESLVKSALTEATNENCNRITELIKVLFPRTTGVNYNQEWDAKWSKEKRIAAKDYFDRYFALSITASDVSDIKVGALLNNIDELSHEEAANQFNGLLTSRNVAAVISKLRFAEDLVSPTQAAMLIRVVSDRSTVFPASVQQTFGSPFQQAAILVSQLLRRVPDERRRQELCSEMLRDTPSLLFACEVMRWSLSDDTTKNAVFSADGETLLKEQLVMRIQMHLADLADPIYMVEPRAALTYLTFWEWFEGGRAVKDYLMLEKHPDTVFSFLRMTSPMSIDSPPARMPFRREQYNLMTKFVDAAVIANIVTGRFGSTLDAPQYHAKEPCSDDESMAHQFMFVHNAVLAERNSKSSQADVSLEASDVG
jgi:hypothetical protein